MFKYPWVTETNGCANIKKQKLQSLCRRLHQVTSIQSPTACYLVWYGVSSNHQWASHHIHYSTSLAILRGIWFWGIKVWILEYIPYSWLYQSKSFLRGFRLLKYIPFGARWARYRLPEHIIQNIRMTKGKQKGALILWNQFGNFLGQATDTRKQEYPALLGMLEPLKEWDKHG